MKEQLHTPKEGASGQHSWATSDWKKMEERKSERERERERVRDKSCCWYLWDVSSLHLLQAGSGLLAVLVIVKPAAVYNSRGNGRLVSQPYGVASALNL